MFYTIIVLEIGGMHIFYSPIIIPKISFPKILVHFLMFLYYAGTATITAVTIGRIAESYSVKGIAIATSIIVGFLLLGVLALYFIVASYYYALDWSDYLLVPIGTIATPIYIALLANFINNTTGSKPVRKFDKESCGKRLLEVAEERKIEKL